MGLSQEQLAEALSISQKQVSKYERGENYPSAETLKSLAKTLDTSTDWLLGLSDNPNPIIPDTSLSMWQRRVMTLMTDKDDEFQRRLYEMAKLLEK